MNAIRAKWDNGHVVTSDSVDWPDGCELLIEPLPSPSQKVGLTESEWRDDAESITAWVNWVSSLEPLELTRDEEIELARFEKLQADFNREAVKMQMAAPHP